MVGGELAGVAVGRQKERRAIAISLEERLPMVNVDPVSVIEELAADYYGKDPLGLKVVGDFYRSAAEISHETGDTSNAAVVQLVGKATEMYRAALSVYKQQSEFQIEEFRQLEQRLDMLERERSPEADLVSHMRNWLSPIASIAVRKLRAEHIENRDFSGLKFQGEFYEKAALMRRRYGAALNDQSILQSYRDALKMYHAALSAYENQSLVQIPRFADYLTGRKLFVGDIINGFDHQPGLSGHAEVTEPVLAAR